MLQLLQREMSIIDARFDFYDSNHSGVLEQDQVRFWPQLLLSLHTSYVKMHTHRSN